MSSPGYAKDRFVGGDHEPFICIICSNVVLEPWECHGCGKLSCKSCIRALSVKSSDLKCPNRCPSSNITPIFSKALSRMYLNLDIKCANPKCLKVVKLIDLPKHESNCLLVKCWNFQVCEKGQNKELKSIPLMPCCSQVCNTLLLLKERFSDKKAMLQIITNFLKIAKSPVNVGQNKNIAISSGSNIWDPSKTGLGIQITENGTQCFLKEQSYLFRTTLCTTAMMGGVHFWQIIADARTENQLKVGVSTQAIFDYNSAFCDHPFGFAYYGLGQLRHNSNASGPSYGKKFKKEGILGICLNMNTGVLAFSLNNQYMGVAFKDPKLKVGPIFPAAALLHCAGCRIRTNLPIPNYFKD